jgi:two-component system cell cycle sensor histidine kinase/response regulator CckA
VEQNRVLIAGGGLAAFGSKLFRGRVMAAILVVEDETQVRVLSESYLQNQGHETLSAANIEEALAVLETAKEIDLLFTDIGLQGDTQAGLTLAQRATERRPELKVLYTTGLPVTDGMKAMFVENSALLPKPYTIDQLQTVLTVNFGIKPQPN